MRRVWESKGNHNIEINVEILNEMLWPCLPGPSRGATTINEDDDDGGAGSSLFTQSV